MKIDRCELRLISLPLVKPFETSFARETRKDALLVCCQGEGLEGWGEVVAMETPLYNEETLQTCWHMLKDFLIPQTLAQEWSNPKDWARAVEPLRRNYMAKAGLEAALWDLFAQMQGQSLAQLWGAARTHLEVGISLGIESHPDRLWEQMEEALACGYRRIKLKIKPGWDLEVVLEARHRFPDTPLQVDANSAYRLEDSALFEAMDDLNLLLIEQPLAHDDIVDHARLQAMLKTPLCLDESIDTLEQCRRALDIGACRVINVKPGRVGGFSAAQAIHDHCQQRGVPCWVGGMLETGVGRLQNLALAALPNFSLPGDLSASRRYFERDLIEPEVTLDSQGRVEVPLEPVGQRLHWPSLRNYTRRLERFPG